MRNLIAFALLALVLFASDTHAEVQCGSALTGPHYVSASAYNTSCTSGDRKIRARTPVEMCAMMSANEYHASFEPYCSAQAIKPASAETGARWRLATRRRIDNGTFSHEQNVVPVSGGDACWESAWSGLSNGTAVGLSPGACDPCPEGMEWNAASNACEAPSCDEGEIYDEDIAACRAVCEGTEFFHYGSGMCKAQCPVGLTYPNLVLTNMKIPQSTIVVPTVNGCKVDYHFWCVEDMKVTDPGGPDQGYWRDDDYTGQICANWWTYTESIPIEIVSQQEWEEATGGAGYFDGDGTPAADLLGNDLGAVADSTESIGDEAGDVTAVHVLCSGGVKRIAITVNGVLDESIFLGPCSQPDGPYTPGGPSQDVALAQIAETIGQVQDTQEDQGVVLDAIQALTDQVKDLAEEISVAVGASEGGPEDPPGEFEGPEAGPEYTTDYEDGLDGVVREAQDGLEETDVQAWLDGLIPTLPAEVEACPSFTLPALPIFHTAPTITPDCRIWDWIKAFLYVATVASCYGILLRR